MAQPVQWGRVALVVGVTALSFVLSMWIVYAAPFDWLPDAPAERWLVATAFATVVATAVLTATSLGAGTTPAQIARRATFRISRVEGTKVKAPSGGSTSRIITDVKDSNIVLSGLGVGATIVLLAALAVVLIVVLTLKESDSNHDSDSSTPSQAPPSATTNGKIPIKDLPGGFTDSSCIYDVTNDQGRGAEPVQINDSGRVSQPFTATRKGYVWAIRAVIGYEPSVEPGPVVLQLLKDGDVLESEPLTIKNNESTEYRFYPVRVKPGAVYEFRVNNESGTRLGIYMAPSSDYPNLEKASVSKEENRPHGRRDKVLSGCVMDASAIISNSGSHESEPNPSASASSSPGNVALPPIPTESSTGPVSAPEPSGSIGRTQNNIQIAKLNGIDLDATESEAIDWRYSPGSDQDHHDFTYSGSFNIIANSVIVPGVAKRSDCEVPGYAPSISGNDISDGTVICVKTIQKKIASIVIRDVDREKEQLTIDVVVWN